MTSQSNLRRRVDTALLDLKQYCLAADYSGPDPYDGLQAPMARFARSKLARQAVVQGVKRSPVNLRPLLRIPPIRMSKSLALFVHGYALAADAALDHLDHAKQLVRELENAQGPTGAWGYEFSVQTRWGFYPAGSPNMVATAFVIEALEHFSVADDTTAAARNWLRTTMWHPAGYFRYVPNNETLVHNANLLGARALARVARTDEDAQLVQTAIRTTIDALPADGLWPYGASSSLEWVDSFHTCYVLDCLTDLVGIGPVNRNQLCGFVQRWFDAFVQEGGHIAYAEDGSGPLDVHNVASSLDLIARHWACLPEGICRDAVGGLLALQRDDGSFALPGKPAYMRWNNAHAFRALARLRGVLS